MSQTFYPLFELTEIQQRGRILDGKAISTARPRCLQAIRGYPVRLVNRPSLALNREQSDLQSVSVPARSPVSVLIPQCAWRPVQGRVVIYSRSRHHTHRSSNRENSEQTPLRRPDSSVYSLHQGDSWNAMLRSRMYPGTLTVHRPLRSTRHKSSLQDLTQQSRVKPPGQNPPTTYKSGTAKFSRILQWTLVPGEFSGEYRGWRDLKRPKVCLDTWPYSVTLANASIYSAL